jgi:hypothetical protein
MDDRVIAGAGGLPKLNLSAGNSSHAEVYLHGATVVSWRPAGDEERLFLSRAARFGPDLKVNIMPITPHENPLDLPPQRLYVC